jgi:hypothetical protein
MILKKLIKDWFLPPKVAKAFSSYMSKAFVLYIRHNNKIKSNLKYKNIHRNNKRCFILLNGPSINEEDLSPLKDEICFSVSNFFHHIDYEYIKPKYHVIPRIFKDNMSIEKQKEWLLLMNQKLQCDTFFLDIANKHVMQDIELLQSKGVAFLSTSNLERTFDISKMTASYSTVAIMCLEIAIYMGFKNIYLLGGDFNSICTGKYEYFFDRNKLTFKDPFVDNLNNIIGTKVDDIEANLNAFKQFEEINRLAIKKNINIFNLSKRSMLDTFEKKSLNAIL